MSRPSMNLKTTLHDGEVMTDDNWMLSYIDVFVLITTLFLMLLVVNKPKLELKEKTHELSSTYVDVRKDNAYIDLALIDPIPELLKINSEASKQNDGQIFELEHSSIGDYNLAMTESIREHGLEGLIHVSKKANATKLEIDSRVLFDSGNAYLTRSGEALLENLLPILKQSIGTILIEGHTDDQPIGTAKYPSNWSLAAARATEVLEFFVSEGLKDSRFRAISYGDTQPLAPNDSDTNRRKNRRVSLVIENAL